MVIRKPLRAVRATAKFCLIAFLLGLRARVYGGGLPAPRPQPASKEYKRSLAAGLAYTGILFRKGFMKHYAAEAHYLFGQAGSSDDDVSAHAFGLRGYRHFRVGSRVQPYAGLEGAYLRAKTRLQEGSGYAGGGFAGIEYYLTSRFSVGFDLGPYYVWFKEKDLGTSEGGMDFILSTYANFYIF